tara:strand:- start:447560 stop:448927 length:1368 start_codon:yes stop_codon:yes gene_type:complete
MKIDQTTQALQNQDARDSHLAHCTSTHCTSIHCGNAALRILSLVIAISLSSVCRADGAQQDSDDPIAAVTESDEVANRETVPSETSDRKTESSDPQAAPANDRKSVHTESNSIDSSAHDLVVTDLVIVATEQVSVPALATGVIAEVMSREGDMVQQGKLLAQLDDEEARLAEAIALNELKIATDRAKRFLAVELAEKNLEHHRLLAKQHALEREISHLKADNNVRVLASEKSEAVAKNELSRATQAREEYVDSVSRSEIDGLRLAYERSNLETEQAQFDRQVDRLTATRDDEASSIHKLNIQRSEIELSRAESDKHIAQLQVTGSKHAADLASLAAKRHWITSPMDGTVAEVYLHAGEWVETGQPVMRLVRLDRLRAEGFVTADQLALLRNAGSVEVSIDLAKGKKTKRDAHIVFISPEIDSVNNEVRFWVEFDNRDRQVLPGMRLTLSLRVEDD